MSLRIRRLLLATTVVALAGCAARPVAMPPPVDTAPESPAQAQERRSQASRPTYNLAGYPPAVRDGYIDGCETAKGTRYGRKDAKRFAADAQYSMGWNDGFGICGKK
jgi:predicted small lipoprotein YifL